MQSDKKICIIDFGGQYAHLIASRIRRLGAYSEIVTDDEPVENLSGYAGIILSGGPSSVYETGAPGIDPSVFNLGIPVLGICYGHQLAMKSLGGNVAPSSSKEYGPASITVADSSCPLTFGLGVQEKVWMSHGDEVKNLPDGFKTFASSDDCAQAGVYHPEKKIFGIQFHPEVTHTVNGNILLKNFVEICGVSGSWNIETFVAEETVKLKKQLGDNQKVFMLVSGGVDSTVAYLLLAKTLGPERVKGLLIDTGFMRKNEVEDLKKFLGDVGVDLNVRDESGLFYSRLKGVTDPEKKRNIIGNLFIEAQENAVADMGLDESWLLGQGTIYPDTIESGGTKHAQTIKTHHNRVGKILELMEQGKVVEPIRDLYKDEVRELGRWLGLPALWTDRHPFPGPGLAVRMILSKKEHDRSVEKKLAELLAPWPDAEFQVLPVMAVGVQGDKRSYANCVALNDFTDDWQTLDRVATKITNSIAEINRVTFFPGHKKLKKFVFHELKLDREHGDVLREADSIATEIIFKHGLMNTIWQMPVVMIPAGENESTYSIVLRPVESTEAMTANFFAMSRPILDELEKKILEIPQISAVLYDITNKPPGTIEWE